MEATEIRGVPLEIFSAGCGEPLLYLHAEQFFEQTVPHLESLSSSRRVIAPRHPRFGKTSPPPDFRSVDDLAYLYLDLLEEMDLRDITLVGDSFGGWIALEMCVRDSSRIRRLALTSPVGVKFGGREERDFADIFYLPDEKVQSLLFADPGRWAPDYASLSNEQLETLAREREATAYYAWRPYMHNPGLAKWLHRVSPPTLLIWGEKDGFVSPDYGRALARSLPTAEFTLVPDAGHYPQIEQSAAVVAAIETFARD